ncbi:NADP-dependent oxidoreductase [Steroidobacter sp.]|uniref:NADP-dependent oxidoreductase n=1 Tax=Steroidobacter sp. TaxID=1978227 RepID=UPI001A608AB1|nr:NADP-dependent oxidoreductase [Steroidobacter sp.]MBL8270876.1 NADP-dependent oxidoreductase [Steroidobacter sp.]
MRAIRMHDYGGPDVLRLDDVPVPEPAAGQVRVRVHATGINPFEWKLREGRMRGRIELQLPHIPGFDVTGVIDKLGPEVSGWSEGDEVIAALNRSAQGGYADYAVASAEDVVRKPASLSFEAATGLLTPAATAYRFLVELAEVKAGQNVFIHGGAGGVGSAAVQIAKALGAHVTTTASTYNIDYLRGLGADEVINYRRYRFEDYIGQADVVLDNVGGDTLARTPAAMKRGAVLVSPAGVPNAEEVEKAGVRTPSTAWNTGAAFGPRIQKLVDLVNAGKLRVNVDKAFRLEDAAAAQELSQQGHARGKLVLKVHS